MQMIEEKLKKQSTSNEKPKMISKVKEDFDPYDPFGNKKKS